MMIRHYLKPQIREALKKFQPVLYAQYVELSFQQETTECTADPDEPILRSGTITGFIQIEGSSMTLSFPETEKGSIVFSGSIVNDEFSLQSNAFQDFIGDNDICPVSKNIQLRGTANGDTYSGDFLITVDMDENDKGCATISCRDPYLKTGSYTAIASS